MRALWVVLACLIAGGVGAQGLYPADEAWSASWVWGHEKAHGRLGLFRREFEVRPGLASAWAQLSGDDGYTLYVNGREVRRGGFWWKTTDRADLRPYLHPGRNVVAARLQNFAQPGGFLLQADLLYADGAHEVLATDDTWRFRNAEPAGDWQAAGYDDSAWERCLPMGRPPDCAPWGELPLEWLGPRFPVERIGVEAPHSVRARQILRLRLRLRLPAQVAGSPPLVVSLRDEKRILLTQRIPVRLPRRAGGELAVDLRLPVNPYAVGGLYRLEAGLRRSRYTNAGARGFRLASVEVLPRRGAGTVTEARVRPYNGAPTLFLNGRPRFALWFYQTNTRAQDAKAFHRAGVDVFTFDLPLGWTGPGKYDFADTDAAIGRLLEANPNAYIVPRLWLQAPGWWIDAHPDEATKMADGTGWVDNGLGGTKHESFASALWRRDASEALRRYVRHVLASPYSDRVIGYHIGNGIYTEWHAWSGPNYPDVSEPMRRHFADYVRRKYQGDESALRAAWGDPAAAFATVRCPTLKERTSGDLGMFRNPARSHYVSDYYEAFHLATAVSLEALCRVVKEETKGRLFTLAFYGYWPDLDWPQEGDHRALDYMVRSPYIDCFASPHSYGRRRPGEDGLFRNHPASLQLNGKLFMDEGDDRTVLARDPEFTHVKTMAESAAVLRRAFGNTLTHNVGMWYMDQQGNWFHDPALMAEIARAKRWGERALAEPRRRTARVAVIVAPHSDFYLTGRGSGLDHVTYPLLDAQIGELCRTGAPFDTYLIDDLADPKMPDYTCYVMLECFSLTNAQRRAVRRKVMRPGQTALWFYAPGFVTEKGLSLEAMSDLIGIRLRMNEAGETLTLRSLYDRAVFGPGKRQLPAFACADPSATPLATYTESGSVGMAAKEIDGFRSVWCGAPGVPASVLRRLFEQAGVHLYVETGDPLTANERFVSIHTATGGRKTIVLPSARPVYDVVAQRLISPKTTRFTVDIPAHETRIYYLALPAR